MKMNNDNAKFIYSKFIRYDVLDQMLPPSLINSIRNGIKLVDLYIDIRSIFKYILSTELIQPKMMSVSILNAAAHYRHYFRKKFNKPVRVFLVDSQNDATGSLFTMINNVNMSYSDEFIETMCRYFPDIYYIKKINFNASSIILTTMRKYANPNNTISIVLSNDIYSYQFPVLNPNTFTIKIGQTKFKIVTQYNAIYEWNPRVTPTIAFNQSLLPFIMALNKCPELSMPCLANLRIVINRLRTLIANGVILNNYNTPNSILVQKGYISEQEYDRWRLADLNTQADMYAHSMQCLDDSWLTKKSCDFAVLASTIDQNINCNPDCILNYVYLIE